MPRTFSKETVKAAIEDKLDKVDMYARIAANKKTKNSLETLALQSGVRAGLLGLAFDLGIKVEFPGGQDVLKHYELGKPLVLAQEELPSATPPEMATLVIRSTEVAPDHYTKAQD
jgi:hypothetical protein